MRVRLGGLIFLLACGGELGTKAPVDTSPALTDTAAVQDTNESDPVDSDGDGVPDVDDDCPDDPTMWTDSDGDGLCDEADPCPESSTNVDTDGDGICDEVDPCPEDPNGVSDSDGDGVCDSSDDCPDSADGFADTNGDGICDGDDDNDGDGIINSEEAVYGTDCGISNPNSADSDDDGIPDIDDPYPRDPWPEFVLFRNESGRIDLLLSNRDGTFQSEIEIGDPHGGTSNTDYQYRTFMISDFDGNGQMDFIAVADPDPNSSTNALEFWWFWREKADEFNQRFLGEWNVNPLGIAADFDNDELIDLMGVEIVRPNTVSTVMFRNYRNTGLIETASCVVSIDPANPDNCAFVSQLAADVTSFAGGAWHFRYSRSAVDINKDGNRDIAMMNIANGGNSSSIPVVVLYGYGDGTFAPPSPSLFNHNTNGCGASPSNAILFGDFNGDDLGDVITGLDDDGDAGSAWFYPGDPTASVYNVDLSQCVEAFDVNPGAESGAENFGVSTMTMNFDVNFDGVLDVMVAYRNTEPWAGSSQTDLWLGNGDGTFTFETKVREHTDSGATYFAAPRRVCERFPR